MVLHGLRQSAGAGRRPAGRGVGTGVARFPGIMHTVEIIRGEKRSANGYRARFDVTVVIDRGPEGRHCNIVAGFRGGRPKTVAAAHDLADELNGVTYIPPVFR